MLWWLHFYAVCTLPCIIAPSTPMCTTFSTLMHNLFLGRVHCIFWLNLWVYCIAWQLLYKQEKLRSVTLKKISSRKSENEKWNQTKVFLLVPILLLIVRLAGTMWILDLPKPRNHILKAWVHHLKSCITTNVPFTAQGLDSWNKLDKHIGHLNCFVTIITKMAKSNRGIKGCTFTLYRQRHIPQPPPEHPFIIEVGVISIFFFEDKVQLLHLSIWCVQTRLLLIDLEILCDLIVSEN